MTTMTKTAVTVVFRTDLDDGTCMAVFSGERGTRHPIQDALGFCNEWEHFTLDREWYELGTRPATAAESQPVWDALLARGYAVTRATLMVWA